LGRLAAFVRRESTQIPTGDPVKTENEEPEKTSHFVLLPILVLFLVSLCGYGSWLYACNINHVGRKWQLYYFVLNYWPSFTASFSAALIFFHLIDRRIQMRDNVLKQLEYKRELKRRAQERSNNIHIALLQQFPPIVQRMVDVQNVAFRGGLYKFETNPNPALTLMTIASDLRHFANVHLDTLESLKHLGVNIRKSHAFAHFANCIATVCIFLVRDNQDPESVMERVKKLLKRMDSAVRIGSPSRSHFNRILIHYSNIERDFQNYNSMSDAQKIEFCSSLSEMVGHSTNLFIEQINKCFKTEVSHLGHPECHSDPTLA
jgi:hypothetical protein